MNYLVYNPSNIKRQALNSLKLPIIAPFPYFMDFEDFNLQIKIQSKSLNKKNINSFRQTEFTLKNYKFDNDTLIVNMLISK